ncbi:MAG: hypothetical protein WA943_03370 [Parvibaculum sp.]|uniref:hypothetical protein n=1 Tax=Parvibaculum sp. TaxID=2024848 RepID=UPI003C720C33
MSQTIFEYLYRDASNYKAHGIVVLLGQMLESTKQAIRERFDSGEFFVASQIGVPDLRGDLWKWSGGQSNEDDHPWHEFVAFREITTPNVDTSTELRTVEDFVLSVSAVTGWKV